MANPKPKWLVALIAIVAMLAIAAIVASNRSEDEQAPSLPPLAPGECRSNADCPPGNQCVAPGKCSQACKTAADCPAGRTCAELKAQAPERDGANTVTTCVLAAP
jgi:Cys-rich repeat protein